MRIVFVLLWLGYARWIHGAIPGLLGTVLALTPAVLLIGYDARQGWRKSRQKEES